MLHANTPRGEFADTRISLTMPHDCSKPACAVLVGHSDTRLSGQTVAVAALLQEASLWSRIRLLHVNAQYASDRARFRKLELNKVLRTFAYLARTLMLIYRHHASVVVMTLSFDRGPFLKDAFVVLALRALSKARLIVWVHMDPTRLGYEQAPHWYAAIVRTVVSRVHLWVGCAPSLLDRWPVFLQGAPRCAIFNGIATPTIKKGDRRAEKVRITYLSAMERLKGWEDLLAAAERLCADRDDVEVRFYGAPASEATAESVREAFAGVSARDKIRWLGPVYGDAKWQALADADLFCFPSHTEQFPITILEAMAVGLPIVASRVGAVEDAIVPGKGGWLVDKASPTELARVLSAAVSDMDVLRSFGSYNRQRFEQCFASSVFGAKWQDMLWQVMQGCRPNEASVARTGW